MKNYIKLSIFALALSTSISACKGSGSTSAADSTKKDSSVSIKVDSSVKKDTTKKDSMKMGGDTTKKTVIKTTEVKKSEAKKQ